MLKQLTVEAVDHFAFITVHEFNSCVWAYNLGSYNHYTGMDYSTVVFTHFLVPCTTEDLLLIVE